MKAYYCDCEHCKFGICTMTGDGWHEPIENDFSCKKEDELVDEDAEWTDNPEDELCRAFEGVEVTGCDLALTEDEGRYVYKAESGGVTVYGYGKTEEEAIADYIRNCENMLIY